MSVSWYKTEYSGARLGCNCRLHSLHMKLFYLQRSTAATHTSSAKLRMAPRRFLTCWLVLVCVIPSVWSCLQCDLAVRHMHEDFMGTEPQMTVQEQMDLKKIINHAYVTYQDTSTQLSGVIGV